MNIKEIQAVLETAQTSKPPLPYGNIEYRTVSATCEGYGFPCLDCNAEGCSERRADPYSKETNKFFEEQERNLSAFRRAAEELGARV